MSLRRSLVPLLLAAASAWVFAREADEEGKLLAVLRSPDAKLFEKARACERLAVVGTKRAVPVLAALLGDERLGDYARFALEPIAGPTVDDALRAALGRLKGRPLIGVINSLGARRDPKAVPALVKIARSGREGAAQALAALGRIATDEAVETLRRALTEGPAARRAAAAHACLMAAGHLVARKKRQEAAALCEAVRGADVPAAVRVATTYQAILVRGPAGAPLLMELLKSGDPALRAVALRAARQLPGPEVTDALAAALRNLPPRVQALVVKALVSRGDRRVAHAIEPLVASEEPAVRREALAALGELGGASAVHALVRAATAGGVGADIALKSLRKLKGDGVDAALIRAMKSAAGDLRAELITVLADRGSTAAVPALLDEAASGDENVARAAFKALGVLASPKHLPAIVRLLLEARRAAAQAETAVVMAAGRIADPARRADAVLHALASAKGAARRAALLRVLGRLGGEGAYAAVVAAVDDKDPAVKDAAVRALAAWPDARATDALLALARNADNELHRILALRGYVRLLGMAGDADPRETARKYAQVLAVAKRPEAVKLVLGGLAEVPHQDALALATGYLDEPDVRAEAAAATLKVARAIMGSDRQAARGALEKVLAVVKSGPMAAQAREAVATIDKFGDSITAWLVAGPYAKEGKLYNELFDIAFEPEKPDAKGVRWRLLPAGTDPKRPWILDLLRLLGGEQRVAYALTRVYSEKAQPARLELGTDDGVKAWLNGKLVHANNVARAAVPYTDKVDITLKAGWNALMLKITQNNSPWEFCARICGRDGKPLRGLRFEPTHEGEWRLPARPAVPRRGR